MFAHVGLRGRIFTENRSVKCIFCVTKHASVWERTYCTQKKIRKKKYTDTVLLPKTEFPLRLQSAKRTEMDNFIYQRCRFSHLYEWQREQPNHEFILHDGPPYANGKPHMGHAINKVLKDITIRHKLLQGFRIHYVPGWDCHGLPIELKALPREGVEGNKLSALEIRKKARIFAKQAIADQLAVFQSWGIMTDWKNAYLTFGKDYIKNQLQQFEELYQKGFVYRDMKPVFWSPSSRTALAEAELEYNSAHVSSSVIVGLQIPSLPPSLPFSLSGPSRLLALVWTTTPWTLPANQAICYNPTFTYCISSPHDNRNELYLFAASLLDAIQEKLKRSLDVLLTFPGEVLKEVTYRHPLNEQVLHFYPGSHVTLSKGTGLVHTAPAHGPDDFKIALQNQMSVVNLVDDNGCYTAEAGPNLAGLHVLEDGTSQVIKMLKSIILHEEDYIHSYPYDWRTKKPIIVKASEQWFFDTNAVKDRAVNLLKNVTVYPTDFDHRNNLIDQLVQRPYWCISRQRVWGVPIPVLYNKDTKEPIVTRPLIEHYTNLLNEHGPDFWWQVPQETLAPDHLLAAHGVTCWDVEKGKDILDIWFDSGMSWSYVLGSEKVADLYMEGVDQFTGWFQSSLITSVALREKAPYKNVFVHGFAVDENGHKMSKSVGNVIDPQKITQGGKDMKLEPAFGADTLRWWVACHSVQHANVPVSQGIMQDSAREIQKLRSVLRFLLGALYNYSKDHISSLSFANAFTIDLYILHRLREFESKNFQAYNNYQYNHVCKNITEFVTNDISSLYCHVTKDRLYCDKDNSEPRLWCLYVLNCILETVLQCIAPILPFLAEEVYLHYPCKVDSEYFFYSKPKQTSDTWNFPHAVQIINTALRMKAIINKTAIHTNTLGLHAQLYAQGEELEALQKLIIRDELNEILQVSSSEVEESTKPGMWAETFPSRRELCPRCRLYSSSVQDHLCLRCEQVLLSQLKTVCITDGRSFGKCEEIGNVLHDYKSENQSWFFCFRLFERIKIYCKTEGNEEYKRTVLLIFKNK